MTLQVMLLVDRTLASGVWWVLWLESSVMLCSKLQILVDFSCGIHKSVLQLMQQWGHAAQGVRPQQHRCSVYFICGNELYKVTILNRWSGLDVISFQGSESTVNGSAVEYRVLSISLAQCFPTDRHHDARRAGTCLD